MKRSVLLFAVVAAVCARLFAAGSGSGSVSFTVAGTAYTQDFNTLSSSAASAALPAGWFLSEAGTAAANNGLYNTGTGTNNAGDTYSFGSAGSTDRAFGTLLSGTLTPVIGASFTN